MGRWVYGWVGALKLPLMCPLHSPACDLRAPDRQKVLKHAGVLTLQPHTLTHTHVGAKTRAPLTHTHTQTQVSYLRSLSFLTLSPPPSSLRLILK